MEQYNRNSINYLNFLPVRKCENVCRKQNKLFKTDRIMKQKGKVTRIFCEKIKILQVVITQQSIRDQIEIIMISLLKGQFTMYVCFLSFAFVFCFTQRGHGYTAEDATVVKELIRFGSTSKAKAKDNRQNLLYYEIVIHGLYYRP